MRYVFNGPQVAHLWANQSQDSARTSTGNFWFNGPVVYSFRTPIAALWPAAKGARVALVCNRQYSLRTAKHRNDAVRALRGNVREFRVPTIGAGGGWSFESAATKAPDHALNLSALVAEYRAAVASFGRMMSRPWDGGRDRLTYLAREARDYSAAFFPRRKAPALDIEADLAEIEAKHAAKDARRADPGYAARQERARERREARKSEERQRKDAARAEFLENQRQRREAQAREDALELPALAEAWRGGARVYRSLHDAPCMLRLRPSDPAIVQTSQGAEVPTNDARRLFAVVARCKRTGSGLLTRDADGDRIPVGGFQVREITAEGDLTVGCHRIAWVEIERFAVAQGWAS